eukprot:comp23475_c0_seq1/m.39237 comp23475_c0_seq1/g.39237  ORF comp23475_c0_seq1/g.39237 comp23475_c0_seq1/m.39237 type:complete len:755 (-) comp23475_c0_seq1:65-2329(-)
MACDFLVVVDFDVTCDASGTAPQEIIVLPWVVIAAESGAVVREDQLLVKPREALTPYCTRLTRITNEQLATADALDQAVAKFDRFLEDEIAGQGRTYCLVTDGAWDLRQCLTVEAAKKGIALKPHYFTYFDVRKEFGKCHPNAPDSITNTKAIMEYLGMEQLPAGSGLPECRRIAGIVSHLLKAGHQFVTPEVFAPADRPQPAPSTRPTQIHHDRIVKLRGLPFAATVEEVKAFFAGLDISPDGVLICLNPQRARPTGEGFVKFMTQEGHDKALAKDRQMIGGRYLEVFSASRQDYDTASALRNEALRNAQGGTAADKIFTAGPANAVLRLRGLPFSVTVEEIKQFFNGYQLAGAPEKSIRLVQLADGRSSGEAFVQLATTEECERAKDERNKQRIGTRYIDVYSSSQFEAQAAFNQAVSARKNYEQLGQETLQVAMGISPGHPIVRLRGLPFSATAQEVQQFLQPASIMANGVNIVYDKMGRHKGEAFVVLSSDRDIATAMAKNRQMIGSRYIEIFPSTRADMLAAMGQLAPTYQNTMMYNMPNQMMNQAAAYGAMAQQGAGFGAAYGQPAAATAAMYNANQAYVAQTQQAAFDASRVNQNASGRAYGQQGYDASMQGGFNAGAQAGFGVNNAAANQAQAANFGNRGNVNFGHTAGYGVQPMDTTGYDYTKQAAGMYGNYDATQQAQAAAYSAGQVGGMGQGMAQGFGQNVNFGAGNGGYPGYGQGQAGRTEWSTYTHMQPDNTRGAGVGRGW